MRGALVDTVPGCWNHGFLLLFLEFAAADRLLIVSLNIPLRGGGENTVSTVFDLYLPRIPQTRRAIGLPGSCAGVSM
jgi:hypothetical protein